MEGLAEMRNEEEMVEGLVNKSIKPRAELTLNPCCGIGPGGGWGGGGVDFAVHSISPAIKRFFAVYECAQEPSQKYTVH